MKKYVALFFIFIYISAVAQPTKKKLLCNPLVVGSIPKKQWSVQAELQSGFKNTATLYDLPIEKSNHLFAPVQGLRLNYYKPLILKQKTFLTLDVGYWVSYFDINNGSGLNRITQAIAPSTLHNISLATTIFKPIDAKHFILINASVECNGNAVAMQNIDADNFVAGGALIFGWKNGITKMAGIGVLRAYRLGKLIHVPALLWNQNFNKKWGVEALLPARATFRYAANKKTFITTGFDLEGTQYAFNTTTPNRFTLNNTFLQRGEIKTKIGLDTELSKRLRFTAQAGVRYMGRFNWSTDKAGNNLKIENKANPNVYANVGLHIMPASKKKKK